MENDLSTSNRTLKDLLNSEYYLEKVLGYLLDDGLYECRLVCHKWYDVCSRLPVKLVKVPITKLVLVVNRFPNAVALSFNSSIKWSFETAEAIESLARLKRLQEIKLHGVFHQMKAKHVLPFFDSFGAALRSCRQLNSLSIERLSNVEAGMCLYSHISHLTGLTHLHLPGGWERLAKDPYTDIRNVEDLAIVSVCLENGQLVFPSLTHLTRLSTVLDVEPAKKFKGGALQMILPYASSLQSLEIGLSDPGAVKTDWALFREFGQLSSAEFAWLHFGTSRDFCAALDCLNLTHLGFNNCRFSTNFLEKLAKVRALTSLKSFNFFSYDDKVHEMFPAMPQLTSLLTHRLEDIESLTVLTALKILYFVSYSEAVPNFSHVFSCIPNLESLDMGVRGYPVVQNSWLSPLKELRSLSLKVLSLDRDIFRTLAQLSGLTQLTLSNCHLQSIQWSGINALTNLESLDLSNVGRTADQMSALMEGKLLKLRHLSLERNNNAYNQWRSLNRKLPNLRQCLIMDPEDENVIYPKGFD